MLRNRDISLITAGPWDHPITFSWHKSKFYLEPEPVPTIIILATRHVVDDVWLYTVPEIHSLLCENFGHVSVEMFNR